ncbi:hypothetical protein VTN96DRAFT_5088 [Rasamsonia emersonii]
MQWVRITVERNGGLPRQAVGPSRGWKSQCVAAANDGLGLMRMHTVRKTPGTVDNHFSAFRQHLVFNRGELPLRLEMLQMVVNDEHGLAEVAGNHFDVAVLIRKFKKEGLALKEHFDCQAEGLLRGVAGQRGLWPTHHVEIQDSRIIDQTIEEKERLDARNANKFVFGVGKEAVKGAQAGRNRAVILYM